MADLNLNTEPQIFDRDMSLAVLEITLMSPDDLIEIWKIWKKLAKYCRNDLQI